jgi:methylglutaconyl-CoA hydratase
MSDVDAEPVHAEARGGVLTLTLDRPATRNALSGALIAALLDHLASAAADPSVRVVLLSHTGPVFCSGVDLAETEAARDSGELPAARLGELLATLWHHPKPVLAKVGGPARAGGLGLIAAADIAVCTTGATFAFSEVRIGVIPAVISATVLPRLTSRAATELFLTGEVFDGTRAADVGLVTVAVPGTELDAAVDRYVEALLRAAPGALAGTKALLGRRTGPLDRELAELTALSLSYFQSQEGIEGVAAYRQKRDPAWVLGAEPR